MHCLINIFIDGIRSIRLFDVVQMWWVRSIRRRESASNSSYTAGVSQQRVKPQSPLSNATLELSVVASALLFSAAVARWSSYSMNTLLP